MASPVRNLSFVASALLGTAVGTFVGLLVAPRSGAATRQGLRRAAGELQAQLPFTLEDLKNRAARKRRSDPSFVQLYREGEGS